MTSLSNKKRRDFLRGIYNVACGVGISTVGIGWLANKSSALPPQAIRPPGALDEKEFLSRCVRCGLCVRDCPYDILSLSDLNMPVPIGTPYFTARTGPCEMCDDIPCVAACPTGALDQNLVDINKARMGLAVLIDQEECIAYQGLRCEVCFNVCPLQGKAIALEYRHNKRSGKHALLIPIVNSEHCTGCGLCEKACIMDEATIKVLPNHIAKGQLGEHYRLGWKQKEKLGKSLVMPDRAHKFSLPEGVIYDYDSSDIQYENKLKPSGALFQSNALDTLNHRRGKK